MKKPLIILCGEAKSGKDTVAEYLAGKHGAGVVAQADPMKRFARSLFGFDVETLWGPSQKRNEPSNIDADKIIQDMSFAKLSEAFLTSIERTEPLSGQEMAKFMTSIDSWITALKKALETKPLSARIVLQTFGTEFGRAFDENLWSKVAIDTCQKLIEGESAYLKDAGLVSGVFNGSKNRLAIITDGRFKNEIQNVKDAGGEAWLVKNPSAKDSEEVKAAGVTGHASEEELKSIPESTYNRVILNDKSMGLQHLYETLDQVVL